MEKEDLVYHPKYGKGFILLPKCGNGVKCKFYSWPFPFVLQEKDLIIDPIFPHSEGDF